MYLTQIEQWNTDKSFCHIWLRSNFCKTCVITGEGLEPTIDHNAPPQLFRTVHTQWNMDQSFGHIWLRSKLCKTCVINALACTKKSESVSKYKSVKSYKCSTIVNFDSRVVIFCDSRVAIYDRRVITRLHTVLSVRGCAVVDKTNVMTKVLLYFNPFTPELTATCE